MSCNLLIKSVIGGHAEKQRYYYVMFILFVPFFLLIGTQSLFAQTGSTTNTSKTYDYVLSSSDSFDSAISSILTRYQNNEKNVFTIGLSSETYLDYFYLDFIDNSTDFSRLSITVEGMVSNVKIQGGNILRAESGTLDFTFKDLFIDGYLLDSRCLESTYNEQNDAMIFTTLMYCKIGRGRTETYPENVHFNGAGIYSKGPITIVNCSIVGNKGRSYTLNNNPNNYSCGGGLYLENNTIYTASVSDCIINDNEANSAAGAYLKGTGRIEFLRNEVYGNKRNFRQVGNSYYQFGYAEGVWCNEASNLLFQFNIIHNQIASTYMLWGQETGDAVCMLHCGGPSANARIVFSTNTIMHNYGMNGLRNVLPTGYSIYSNNLSAENYGGIISDNGSSSGAVTYNYNDCYNNFIQDAYGQGWNIVNNNYNEFYHLGGGGDYHPFWDSYYKSICIGNGNPDLDGDGILWYDDIDDQDYFNNGNRLGIGALRPTATYTNEVIRLKKNEVWNWICIPGIDFPGNYDGRDHIDYVFDSYHNNNLFNNTTAGRYLDKIMWLYNDDDGSVTWRTDISTPSFVFPEETHHVRAQYGYKVKLNLLNHNLPDELPIEYIGFRPGTTGNSVNGIVIDPAGPNEDHCIYNPLTHTYERETWLGYYKAAGLQPLDAFAPILDKIVSIKAQEWSIDRIIANGQYTDDWLGYVTPGSSVVINSGEMVSVRYIGPEQAEFNWGDTYPIPPEFPRYERPQAEFFTFEKRPDYLPVYAILDFNNLPPEEQPVEIAIYVDGVCKGAEKINSDFVQIKAYLSTDDMAQFHDKVIEFVLKTPSKSANQVVKRFAFRNPDTNQFEVRNIIPDYCQNYIQVSLKSQDVANANFPSATALKGNYPNPFNPETTIKFDLAKSGATRLEIFNVKGQVVNTLVNGPLQAGYHSVKWNGLDNHGNRTSSGVYFYRLITGGKVLTNKMLMLK